jgi:hypothetical protein
MFYDISLWHQLVHTSTALKEMRNCRPGNSDRQRITKSTINYQPGNLSSVQPQQMVTNHDVFHFTLSISM